MTRPLPFVALLLAIALPASTVGATTIGYVDMQKVLEESKIGRQLQEELRVDFEPRGRALAQEEQEIMQLQQSLKRDAPLMSQAQVAKQESEIKTRIETYQEQATAIQRELMQVQKDKGREIIVPARAAVNAIAKKNKVDMVVERSLAGLLYIDEALDMTADVIKQLDATSK